MIGIGVCFYNWKRIWSRIGNRIRLKSGVKLFLEGVGLVDGNGIFGNVVKGEGVKEVNLNEEFFWGVILSRS